MREDRWNVKKTVLSYYSGGSPQCSKCNNEDIRVLALDHIYSNGAQSRKEKSNGQGGVPYYRALIKLNYPDGYQVLCSNCHIIVEQERRDALLEIPA